MILSLWYDMIWERERKRDGEKRILQPFSNYTTYSYKDIIFSWKKNVISVCLLTMGKVHNTWIRVWLTIPTWIYLVQLEVVKN